MGDPFAAAVDAAFRIHGIDAVVNPDGAATAVRLLPNRPDDIADIGAVAIQSKTTRFEIRASEAGAVAKGSVIAVEGSRYRVQAPPRAEDSRRLKRVLNMVPV